MHTATELSVGQFAIEIDGRPGSREELLPGWDAHDRFGIVVDAPLGALGASLLIQLVITAFYDARPDRREALPQYPEIYAFHIGQRHGDLSFYDFWPPRKEVLAQDGSDALLAALDDHAITRLALPEGLDIPGGDPPRGWSSWADRTTAEELLRSVWLYASSGRVSTPDVSITGADEVTERNVASALDPAGALARYRAMSEEEFVASLPGPTTPADMRRWMKVVQQRLGEVGNRFRDEAASRRRQLLDGSPATETYRRIEPAEALAMLGQAP
jgi:hypothetical protein